MKIVTENRAKNKTHCCVPQCTNGAYKNPHLSFHRFPGESTDPGLKRRQEWKRVLRIGKPVSNTMVVCSSHFQKSDYILPGCPKKCPRLKLTAVPSLNLPVSVTDSRNKKSKIEEKKAKRAQRYAKISRNNANLKETLSTSSASEMPNCSRNINISADVQPKQTNDINIPEDFGPNEEYSPNFIAEVVIKEELPWGDDYIPNRNTPINGNEKEHIAYNQIPITADDPGKEDYHSNVNGRTEVDIGDKKHEERNSTHIQNNNLSSRIKNSYKEKSSEFIISERERLFGLLIASEISPLCENNELYIRTKQTILTAIADAQMELLTGEENIM